ncbi:MAG: ABC transporter ATP-binding protein [Chthoniobacteraceae bacterium]
MLEAQQLNVSLSHRRIVHEATLTLGRGEVVGLIGANGSGKSTLLRALAGLIPLESGRLLLSGKPLDAHTPRQVAQTMAYLPQAAECQWPLTADRVVALGRLPFRGGSRELDRAQIDKALNAVDALYLRDRVVTELSGGERARVMLARALAGDPALLLIDEPAAGLDPYHQLQLMEMLRQLASESRGVLVVLHDLGMAARFCDRVLVMHEGQIIASGPPDDVLTDALLARAHGITAFRSRCRQSPVLVPWGRIGTPAAPQPTGDPRPELAQK